MLSRTFERAAIPLVLSIAFAAGCGGAGDAGFPQQSSGPSGGLPSSPSTGSGTGTGTSGGLPSQITPGGSVTGGDPGATNIAGGPATGSGTSGGGTPSGGNGTPGGGGDCSSVCSALIGCGATIKQSDCEQECGLIPGECLSCLASAGTSCNGLEACAKGSVCNTGGQTGGGGNTGAGGNTGTGGSAQGFDCNAGCAALAACDSSTASSCANDCASNNNGCQSCLAALTTQAGASCNSIGECSTLCGGSTGGGGGSAGSTGSGGSASGSPECDAAASTYMTQCMVDQATADAFKQTCSSYSTDCLNCIAAASSCAGIGQCAGMAVCMTH